MAASWKAVCGPSSDLATHVALYRAFPAIGGVVHTHSRHATAWAQAGREIPCFGTTHADYFHGPVPVTEPLSRGGDRRRIRRPTPAWRSCAGLKAAMRSTAPACWWPVTAPFCWGRTVSEAAHNAVILEEVAAMALETVTINPRGCADFAKRSATSIISGSTGRRRLTGRGEGDGRS